MGYNTSTSKLTRELFPQMVMTAQSQSCNSDAWCGAMLDSLVCFGAWFVYLNIFIFVIFIYVYTCVCLCT